MHVGFIGRTFEAHHRPTSATAATAATVQVVEGAECIVPHLKPDRKTAVEVPEGGAMKRPGIQVTEDDGVGDDSWITRHHGSVKYAWYGKILYLKKFTY